MMTTKIAFCIIIALSVLCSHITNGGLIANVKHVILHKVLRLPLFSPDLLSGQSLSGRTSTDEKTVHELQESINMLRDQIAHLKRVIDLTKSDNWKLTRETAVLHQQRAEETASLTQQHEAALQQLTQNMTASFEARTLLLLQEAKARFEEEKKALVLSLQREREKDAAAFQKDVTALRASLQSTERNNTALQQQIKTLRENYQLVVSKSQEKEKKHAQSIAQLSRTVSQTTATPPSKSGRPTSTEGRSKADTSSNSGSGRPSGVVSSAAGRKIASVTPNSRSGR